MSTNISGLGISKVDWSGGIDKLDGNRKIDNDEAGVGLGGKNQATTLSLPNPTSKPEMMKMMAAFEDLIILMSLMAKEIQKGEREAELAGLAAKISLLLSAAKEKQDGADKMMSQAIASLVISVVSAAISVVGSAISLKGAVSGLKAAGKVTAGKSMDIDKTMNKAIKEAGPLGGQAIRGEMQAQKLELQNANIGKASKAFDMASKLKTSAGGVIDAVGKGVGAGAGYTGTKGQAESMRAQAEADKLQARAEEVGSQAQRSQQMQQDMRDLLNKMTELLNAFYQAQDKIASAASH